MRARIRFDYYEVTAEGGDNGLFKDKITSIVANVAERDREIQIGTSLYNFNAVVDEQAKLIVGNIRDLRYIVPSKGKAGTNKTEPITLAENEGISEKTYFVYNYEKNKLAIHYNYHGPKIANLFSIINKLYKERIMLDIIPRPEFVRSSYRPYILGSEVALALASNHITCIVAKTKKPVEGGEIDEDADFPELVSAYGLPLNITKELILKDRHGGLSAFFQKFLRRNEDIEYYDKFQVNMMNPQTDKVDQYDLISNKLKHVVEVALKENSREIDSDSAVVAIRDSLASMVEKYGW
jgi:hypothetical protein